MNGDPSSLADAIAATARQQGVTTPAVRGADWQTMLVTDANNPPGTVRCGEVVARCLESYVNPAVGEYAIVTRSGAGNWLAVGRTAEAVYGGWTPYTPVWTAATTNPNLGNGALVGRYQKTGATVACHINLIPGSSTTFGSGAYSLTIPVPAANAGCTYIGHAHLIAGSTRYGGDFVISPGATLGGPYMPPSTSNSSLAAMTAALPGGFTSGNSLRITVVYETSS